MDQFKFELIRASAAQEILDTKSAKFTAITAQALVDSFVDFASVCGYQKESLAEAFSDLNRCTSTNV